MGSVCGIIDFSMLLSDVTDFSAIRRMWCSTAPMSRGYIYLRGGIALACDNDPRCSATLPCTAKDQHEKNCTLMLCGAHPSPFYARDVTEQYMLFGIETLVEAREPFSFVFLDEKERLLVLSCAKDTFYCARAEKKIIFSTEKSAINAYFSESALIPMQPIALPPKGFAMFCDIKVV